MKKEACKGCADKFEVFVFSEVHSPIGSIILYIGKNHQLKHLSLQ